jgi:MFS family permease
MSDKIVPDPSSLSYARRALIASIAGYAMDGFDLLVLGFLLRPIAAEFGLSKAQSGSLVTWTLLGAVVGGLLFGMLSDYYGRVKVLSWTILLFAAFTGMCALAQGYCDLVVYRIIAGLGLGGEFGIGMTLVGEAWPPRMRARASSYVALGWQSGVLLAALLTPALMPLVGWRGMFVVGLFPAVVAFFLRRYLGEPEVFIRKKQAAKGVPLAFLVRDRTLTKATIGMFILCSVQNFGYYGLITWLPTYLADSFGYTLTRSSLWTAVTILGMSFGIWLFGVLADLYGRRPIFILYQAGAALSVLCYAHFKSSLALLIGGAVMGLFVNGMIGGYGAMMSELYPTEARATAQNTLFNLGRGVGGFGPYVVGLVTAAYSFKVTAILLSSTYILDIFATAFLLPETRGVTIE